MRVAGRGPTLEMPDRQRAMLGNEHLRDDDVVARRALQADRPPGIDDLDLAARQGVVTVDIDAVLLGEGGEQAPVAGVDAADQRPAARQHVAAVDAAPATAGRNEDAADQAGGIVPYVELPLVGPLREHEVVGEMLDQAPGARPATAAHRGQGFDSAPHVGFATAEPCRLVEAGRAGRFQVGNACRQHLPQVVDGFRALAKDRNEGLRPGNHLGGAAGGRRWPASGRSFDGGHGIPSSMEDWTCGAADRRVMVEQRPCHHG